MWSVCFPVMVILFFVWSRKLKLSDAFNCVTPLWLEQLGSKNPKWWMVLVTVLLKYSYHCFRSTVRKYRKCKVISFLSSLSIADVFSDVTVFWRGQKGEHAYPPHCLWLCFFIKLDMEVSIWTNICLARSRTLKNMNSVLCINVFLKMFAG